MMLGQIDTKGKKEGVDNHDEKSKPNSIWARMKSKTLAALATAAVATAASFGACTFQEDGVNPVPIPGQDASTQDGGQGGKDSGPDVDSGQGGHDAGQEDAGQGGMDAGQEDAGQGGQDAGQGGMDAGQEDAGQGGQDAGLPVCPGATTGNYAGTVGKITPVTAGGYSYLYKGMDGNGYGLLEISCQSNSAVIFTLPCPLNVSTDYDLPQDTKRITVHPTQIGAGAMVGSITVANHP